jgi:outer membrane protein TolC
MNAYRETLVRSRWAVRALIALLSLSLLGVVPTSASERRSISTAPGSAIEGADLRIEDGKLRLTLDEAIELALARNLGLSIQRYSRARAGLRIEEALGSYDFNLTAGLSRSHNEAATASTLEGAAVQKQDSNSFRFGAAKLVPSGGTVSIDWTASKLETNSAFFTLNPSFNSGLDFTFRQPLLRNRGRDATEFGLEVARLGSEQSLAIFEEQVVSTLQQVELAYWGVVEAQEQLKVSIESRGLAEQLHENNRVRVDVGTLAPLELVSSEAGIATREEEVIRAGGDVGNAEDVLKSLLRVEGMRAWAAGVVPETDPAIEHPEVDLESALQVALEARPEIDREQVAQRSRELEAAYYSAQVQPRLDLRLNYGYSGTGGDLIVRDSSGNIISTVPGGVDDALQQILDGDFPGWTVALDFGYPIGNRSAKARSRIASLSVDEGAAGIARLEQIITTEVRLAVRGIETSRQELESAAVSVRLQTANLDAERKKFINGLSTSFQILQVEEDLTSARSREVRAVTGYRRALVGYYSAIGKLLDQTGVTIVD